MKKKIVSMLIAIAMMATGAASLGCFWIMVDEPKAFDSLCD